LLVFAAAIICGTPPFPQRLGNRVVRWQSPRRLRLRSDPAFFHDPTHPSTTQIDISFNETPGSNAMEAAMKHYFGLDEPDRRP
jgi:hypothetical protein